MTFASVVGMVTLRKKYINKLAPDKTHIPTANNADKPETDDIPTTTVVPQTPRFCTMLSPEAQFAMLKGKYK